MKPLYARRRATFVTMRVPFVSRYFCKGIGVRSSWNTPESRFASCGAAMTPFLSGVAPANQAEESEFHELSGKSPEFQNHLFMGCGIAFKNKWGFRNQFRTFFPKVRQPQFLRFGLLELLVIWFRHFDSARGQSDTARAFSKELT